MKNTKTESFFCYVEVDGEKYRNLLREEKVNIGWDQCRGKGLEKRYRVPEMCWPAQRKRVFRRGERNQVHKLQNCHRQTKVKNRLPTCSVEITTETELTTKLKHNQILYLNSQSYLAHFEQIEILAETYTSSIIILSETCTTTDIEPFEVDIQGHISVRCDSHSRHTGGVFVLIRKDIRFTFMSSAILERNAWILSLRQQKTVLDRRHYSGHKLQTYRSQQNWDYITELHFNDKAKFLNDIIKNGVKNLLSTRYICLRKQKWYTNKLDQVRKQRDGLYKLAKLTNNVKDE
ncbi:hypothetical protein ILUMI_14981 [Ignelater luminosus]|uniref:Uncharacterized protein n=1 Tax=Ignelater luminosus TaxID=2038154 RepID=A0A8K0G7A6_IGNLU|nr:hypothetical protein ILUMI_14981 [Ignelater luminosus]